MGVEEDKDEVDWDDEDEVDWKEDGEERVEEDLSLEGRVRGQDEVSDVPLPALAERQEGLMELRRQQERDDSLDGWRDYAKKGEKGYGWKEGILIQTIFQDPGQEWIRIVVPRIRRREILNRGYKGLVGGHFSHRRMIGSIRRPSTWPGMIRDVRRYCRSCPECQKAGRPLPPRVPMVQMPIISVPYGRLACDLVGPLPRTKNRL